MNQYTNSNNKEELHVVTEVGVFGGLDINDPTKKKVHTKDELDALIKEAHQHNLGN